MICCNPTIINFLSVSSTVVNYNAQMVLDYGPEPNVQVYFQHEDGMYVLSDDMNQVSFDGVNIVADYGGPATGFLKIF
jgi:hypothetical protein